MSCLTATCLTLALELAARGGVALPDPGLSRTLDLPRSRADLALERGHGGGRLALLGQRSGGAVGVSGEAWLPVLGVAELWWWTGDFSLAAGIIEDPWLRDGDATWQHRPLAPVLAQDQGWLPPSDLGALARWQGPRASAELALLSGEGAWSQERNEGKDLQGALHLTPLARDSLQWRISLMGRQGSRGLSSARDHRAALRSSLHAGPWTGGVELHQAWGVDGDPARAPLGLSGWVSYIGARPVAVLRADQVWERPGEPDASHLQLLGAAGLVLPQAPDLRLLAAASHQRWQPQALPYAGASGAAQTTTLFIQLEARLTAGPLALESSP